MDQRMSRPTRFALEQRAHPTGSRPPRTERDVSWSDFRSAVRFDPQNRVLVAVPAISAKRAEHPWLGDALTPFTRVGENGVYRRDYEQGSVYWSRGTGAHEVHGGIAARWHAEGGVSSLLGLPTTDVLPLAEGREGGCTHFEGGSVYWTPRHGAVIVRGMVRDIWALLGWERSALGAPVADVVLDATTGLWSGGFEHGSITWSPPAGHEITVVGEAAPAG
jgi:uncharacterized protein with LGFP repeats